MLTAQPQPLSDVQRAVLTSVVTEHSLKMQAFVRLLTSGQEVNIGDLVDHLLAGQNAIETIWNSPSIAMA